MPNGIGNRVYVNTTTVGTGTLTLGTAFSDAFCTAAEGGVTDGQTVTYIIEEGNDFEIGTGVYATSGTTLTRATVRLSKIGGTAGTTKMTLAGAATVRLIVSAEDTLSLTTAHTANGVLIAQAARGMASTGAGTLGQHLVSNGSGSDPTFKSGGWTLLNTLTASSSASLSDTTNITSTYTEYEFVLESIVLASGANSLTFQVQVGGSFQTASYVSAANNANGTAVGSTSATGGALVGVTSLMTTSPIVGRYILSNPSQTTSGKIIYGNYVQIPGPLVGVSGGAYTGGNGAVTGIRLIAASGNITSGTMKIYGRL